ncbi:MAG: type II secretion system F family protein [Phycisphaerae bacterium]|nr:type II secretion system F family protein [Phycisphaerae bacterium]
MKVAYEGFTLEGQAVNGTIEAGDRGAAVRSLREQGIVATRVDERGAAAANAAPLRRLNADRLAAFLRQAALLVSTGTPLVEALVAIERQSDDAVRRVSAELRRRVEEGAALSEAMAAMPRIFDPICRTMTNAGETAGILDRMLTDLAQHYRRQARVRRAVIAAVAYPMVVVAASFCVLIGLLVFVVPRFRSMFDAVQAPIPAMTDLLITVGTAISEHWILSLVVGLLAIGASVGAILWRPTRRWVAARALALPAVGNLTRSLATAQLVRGLGLLLDAKVSLLDALRLTREAMTHPAYVDLLARAEEAVSRGESLASVMETGDCIPPSVCQAIASAERSGKIGPVLTQVSQHLDEDNETAVRGLARALEPLLLGVLGAMIAFVAISLFLPLFDVAASAGGGPRP